MARAPGLPGMQGVTSYLPPHMVGGVGNVAGGQQRGFPSPVGKSLRLQNLGNILGLRGAGMAKGGGSQLAHSFNHYGKSATSGLEGGTEPSGDMSSGSFGF